MICVEPLERLMYGWTDRVGAIMQILTQRCRLRVVVIIQPDHSLLE